MAGNPIGDTYIAWDVNTQTTVASEIEPIIGYVDLRAVKSSCERSIRSSKMRNYDAGQVCEVWNHFNAGGAGIPHNFIDRG